MELSKNFLQLLNTIFPFADFLYILQLEEYYSRFYFKDVSRFFFRRNLQKRDTLKYTSRIKTTLLTSIGLFIFSFVILSIPPSNFVFSFIISCALIPIFVGIANIILTPLYDNIRKQIQVRARHFIQRKKQGPKIIAIAGSYGKTTTKNMIYQLIRYSYKTQVIPGNINTPTGIAAWLLKNYDETADYLIVEMDTYEIGEIKKSTAILPPDIAILTNIGDQHLMRFSGKKELAKALNEIFDYAKPQAIKINGEKLKKISYANINDLLSQNLPIAIEVAKLLKISKEFVEDTIKTFKIPERRGNLVEMHGYKVIDNSYNISPTTAHTGILYAKDMAKIEKRKLVVVTAGIPELGEENKKANKELGRHLDQYADEVILFDSILQKEVSESLKNKNAYIANSMTQLWDILKTKHKSKDILILLQPELNDLYYNV